MDLFDTAREIQKFANTWGDKEDISKWKIDEVFAMIDDYFDVIGVKWNMNLEDKENSSKTVDTDEILAEVFQEIGMGYECASISTRKRSERLIEVAYTLGRVNGLLSLIKDRANRSLS